MRDQLTIGCDAHQGGGKPDAAAPKAVALPKDFALWGAEFGIRCAKLALATVERPERRRAIRRAHEASKILAANFREIGASVYDVKVYRTAFVKALDAQLAEPHSQIEIRIIS